MARQRRQHGYTSTSAEAGGYVVVVKGRTSGPGPQIHSSDAAAPAAAVDRMQDEPCVRSSDPKTERGS